MDKDNSSFFSELLVELRQVWSGFTFGLSGIGVGGRNLMRRLRDRRTDYVVLPLGGSLPERSGPPRGFWQRRLPLPPQPLTMAQLNLRLQAIADAGNVKGVLFVFQGLGIGLASCQALRQAIKRLQAAGKEAVVFTPYLDLVHYYAASAAGRIVVPPVARFEMLGLRIESVFLKDALDRLGVKADVVQISPFKTAYNELSQSEMPPEQEQQLTWLLDDVYEQITGDIARDRGLEPERLKELIDTAPHSPAEARAAGLIDDIAYEDTLQFLLAAPKGKGVDSETPADEAQDDVQTGPAKARPKVQLSSWNDARRIMLEKRRRPAGKYIGVVSLAGAITMGASRSTPLPIPIPIPLFSANTSGEGTLSGLLRRAEKDRRMAALIVHIDSGGGSALASDLIWRQLQRIAQRVPVVAYMGNTAASGGYYVAAAARRIVSQPLTLTGSIGVVTVHMSTGGFFEKLDVNRVALQRGRRAHLTSDLAPLSEEERQVLWTEIDDTYQRFLQIVASGRGLDQATLDPICQGRVWTGRQALEKGLIDQHGDFHDAVSAAASLAGLPMDDLNNVRVYDLYAAGATHVLPKPLEEPAEFLQVLFPNWLAQFSGKPSLMMPVRITFK
jgi:protease-4